MLLPSTRMSGIDPGRSSSVFRASMLLEAVQAFGQRFRAK